MSSNRQKSNDLDKSIETAFLEAASEAASSDYDRTVCITAIYKTKEFFTDLPPLSHEENKQKYLQRILTALQEFQQNYNDSDGKYTNGRAIIGNLISKIHTLKTEIQ